MPIFTRPPFVRSSLSESSTLPPEIIVARDENKEEVGESFMETNITNLGIKESGYAAISQPGILEDLGQ